MLDFIERKDGRLTQRFFGAHTYRRTVFYEDWTGKEIIRVLMDQVRRRKIVVDSNHLIFDSPYVDNVYTTTPFFAFRILIILSCYPLLSCICLSLSLSRLLVGDIRNAILQ